MLVELNKKQSVALLLMMGACTCALSNKPAEAARMMRVIRRRYTPEELRAMYNTLLTVPNDETAATSKQRPSSEGVLGQLQIEHIDGTPVVREDMSGGVSALLQGILDAAKELAEASHKPTSDAGTVAAFEAQSRGSMREMLDKAAKLDYAPKAAEDGK